MSNDSKARETFAHQEETFVRQLRLMKWCKIDVCFFMLYFLNQELGVRSQDNVCLSSWGFLPSVEMTAVSC
ncbi:MAG: hypothetical protein DRJ10_05380 [Bacteroidetes bacterium]|nr:MAG: hypothetical protein DRJ10_05380 [Bacteroidota bacterium]